MFKINPYRPGAGLMPGYIAGREKDITNIEQIFDALIMNIPVQSVIFSGLRGVGKTVLINKLESIAEEKKIFVNISKLKKEMILFHRLQNVHRHFSER